MSFELATSQSGLNMFLKEWQITILSYLWSIHPSGATSAMVWSYLKGSMSEPMSRASVINFLKDPAEKGVLREDEKPGKGGYHGVYHPNFSESEFKRHLAEHFIRRLMEEYPDETRKVLIDAR